MICVPELQRLFNQYDDKNIERGVTEHQASRMAFLRGWAVNIASKKARGAIPKCTRWPARLLQPQD